MMEEKRDFASVVKKSLDQLPLREVAVDPGLKRIEVEGGSIEIETFKAEKIEKLTFSTIKIHESSVSEESLLVWPEDTYDLPLFWCNLTQMPGMNIFINDFSPLMDVVVWPQYGEKYLDDLLAIKDSAAEKLKDGMVERKFKLSTKTAWALSPHRTIFSLTDACIPRLGPIVDEYCKLYLKLWQDSAPIKKHEERQFCKRKKEALRKMMKENDPGYHFMVNIFGEDKTHKVFDLIF